MPLSLHCFVSAITYVYLIPSSDKLYQEKSSVFLDKSQKMMKQNLDFHSFFVVEKSPWKIY